MDDETILAQANDMIQQQKRAHQPSAGSKPVAIGETIARLRAKLDATPDESPDVRRLRTEVEAERERQRRAYEWDNLARRLGRRYRNCTLVNFRCTTDTQRDVHNSVRGYAEMIGDSLVEGRSVLLYGPPGTGKDHLATCIMRAAVLDVGAKVDWTDGADFYGAMRDNIDTAKSESALLAKYRDPDLLAISDPVPPLGRVDSTFQLSMLFRVVDRRYRDQKATMMTLNVASREEAEQRLSPNVIDRLGHGALVCHCNWPSYRR